jgi:hypothetical protein
VHWSLGPDYFTRDLVRSFAFVEGGQERRREPEAAGVPSASRVRRRADRHGRLTGARIITMAARAGRCGPT